MLRSALRRGRTAVRRCPGRFRATVEYIRQNVGFRAAFIISSLPLHPSYPENWTVPGAQSHGRCLRRTHAPAHPWVGKEDRDQRHRPRSVSPRPELVAQTDARPGVLGGIGDPAAPRPSRLRAGAAPAAPAAAGHRRGRRPGPGAPGDRLCLLHPWPHDADGWQHRNAILAHLRQVTPHDLRLPSPARTAVLLRCREGAAGWTEQDGAWMWALRDAATLHGLRCGAYVALTPAGWQILGDGRSGRNPHAGSWAEGPVHTVTELPSRTALEGSHGQRPLRPAPERPQRGERPQRSRQGDRPWTPARVTAIEPARRTGTR